MGRFLFLGRPCRAMMRSAYARFSRGSFSPGLANTSRYQSGSLHQASRTAPGGLMTRAARSIFVFGIYSVATGVTLVAAPNALLSLLRLTPTTEPWIRVLGIVVVVMGSFFIAAARNNVTPFFHFTLWGRAIVLIGLTALILLQLAPPVLILFGLIDAAGAVWTRTAL